MTTGEGGLLPPTILIVDDEEPVRQVLKDLLEDDGYAVLNARHGRDALLLATQEVDMILLDIRMPVLDGVRTCGLLSDNPETSHIPVLFLSGYADEEVRAAALRSGAFDFLWKPVRAAELRAKVGALSRILNVPQPMRKSLYLQAVQIEVQALEKEDRVDKERFYQASHLESE